METKDGLKVYKCPSYLSTFKDGVHVIREKFCDTRLKAGGKIFRAHKVILAAHSKYFYSIFVQNFNERESGEIRIPPEIDADTMTTILNYFYSGELALSQSNIESVFRATDYMRLDSLLEICIGYMQEILNPSNCVRRYVMAETLEYSSQCLDSLKKAASRLIIKEAVKIYDSEEFLSLSLTLVSKLLKCNNDPDMAESIYMLISKWVGHDEENRGQFLYELLQMLPVEGISNEFFTSRMRNEQLLRKDTKVFQWLFDTFVLRLANPASTSQSNLNSFFIMDRNYTRKCFLVKLQNPVPQAICDRPNIESFSAVSYKKRIYLLCAEKTEKSYRLDNPEGSWTESGLDLKFGRDHTGCVVRGDDLFVIGGCDDYKTSDDPCVRSCFKFHFGSGQKEGLRAMNEMRGIPGVGVYANAVYVAGGWDASPLIERFDDRIGMWKGVSWCTKKIGGCSSAVIDDYLYTCDINDGKVERFDFRNECSEEICSLPSKCGMVNWISSVDGELFGAGEGKIFKYNRMTDKWKDYCSGENLKWPLIVPWI